jgi:riboflavin biosynthesis pyrimidine reductase
VRRLFPRGTDDTAVDDAALDDTALDDTALILAYRLPAGRSLRVNFVVSLDGAVTVDGRSRPLGSPGDQRIFTVLRTLADAVLVGHGTAVAEGYRPPVVVVSQHASLDPGSRLVTGAVAPTILVTCAAADAARRAALAAAGVTVLVCGDEDVDLSLALDRLAGLGHEQVLCEGGPQLLRTALAAGVVDELDLSIAPALVGGETRLLGAALPAPARLHLRQVLEEDGLLFTRYGVSR